MNYKRKFELLKNNQYFCSVPWHHFKIETDGDVSTCVRGNVSLGNINNQDIEEILKHPELDIVRKSMLDNKSHKNCNYCVQKNNEGTEVNYHFLRNHYNPIFKSVDIDYDKDSFIMAGVDLHWSSTCNLKCITCHAPQSSAIAKEQGVPIKHVPSDRAENVINYIVKNQHNMKEIYLSGGEPSLIKHNLKLLKSLDKSIDCQIRINTNMMFTKSNQIINELKKFKNVLFTISVDGLDSRFEYIRRESSWQLFLRNLEELKKTHFSWRINSVFFVGTASTITETQMFFYNNFEIDDFTINQVEMGHTNLQCRNLPDSVKNQVRDNITEFLENNSKKFKYYYNTVGQYNACLNELNHNPEEDYIQFFEDVDKKVGSNWKTIFPELVK